MSTSHLIKTIVTAIGDTRPDADEVEVARAIVSGLSAAGYEIVRARAVDDEPGSPRLTVATSKRAG